MAAPKLVGKVTEAFFEGKTEATAPTLPTGVVSGDWLLLLVNAGVDDTEDEVTSSWAGATSVLAPLRVEKAEANLKAFMLQYTGTTLPKVIFSRESEGVLLMFGLSAKGNLTTSGFSAFTASKTAPKTVSVTPTLPALVFSIVIQTEGHQPQEPTEGWQELTPPNTNFQWAVAAKEVAAKTASGEATWENSSTEAYGVATLAVEEAAASTFLAMIL